MNERYRVSLSKEAFTFSAAHFITFNDSICERLHGHNYLVAVDFDGELDGNKYVVDFIALRDELSAITRSLDHYVLLPTLHPQILVEEDQTEVTVHFEDRRWIFPANDCVLLPVANTTAELLARHIGTLLLKRLEDRGISVPAKLAVSVDECQGQQGIWTVEPANKRQ